MNLSETQAERIRAMGARFSPAILAETREIFAGLVEVSAPTEPDLRYGDDARQALDVYGAKSGAREVMIYVPGGGFIGGDKDDGRSFYRNVGAFFVRQGFVCVIPNYRLAPAFAWPSGGADVKAVVDWCRANIARYGGDPQRIHLIGQSAGATHVATALFHPDFAVDGALASAVLFNGPYDATDMPAAENLIAYFGPEGVGRSERSPLAYVRKTALPILLGATEFDPAFLAFPSFRMADALTKANGKSPAFLWLAGHNHVSCVFAIGSPFDDLGPELVKFIRTAKRG